MAKTSQIVSTNRLKKKAKYKTRVYNRCGICGRNGGYMRKFGICRICFRQMAHKGLIPGVKKDSW
ncbi:MAG TPA: type Z 30S ribosomal protein S14 [Patescibacteria group bacterium]|nr:type Z 30S ribosomal protein S14 [Patescibacteria group bacterium]